jgi:hypothetical protein
MLQSWYLAIVYSKIEIVFLETWKSDGDEGNIFGQPDYIQCIQHFVHGGWSVYLYRPAPVSIGNETSNHPFTETGF